MADQVFALALNRPTRDSYGFALRPQHAQRYREYANIYKEEEEERSDRWNNFLDQVVESTHSCSSEKECRETDLGTLIRDDGSISSESEVEEKAEQISEGTKSENAKKWAQIRSSLGALERMLSSRVEKQKKRKTKDEPEIEITSVSGEEDLGNEVLLNEDASEPDKPTNEERSEADGKARVRGLETENSMEDGSLIEPFFSWKEELESLVRGGVPKDLRGEVWQALVGVKARRVERYYNDLLAREETKEKEGELCSAESKWKRQIEKDIPRTFPGHPALNENGRNSLRRVLLAYARHNPSVGYCQAMNFFAGLLLLLMPEENAFWTLVGVLDNYFEGYYTEEMIESQVDQLVFEELMRERFPKLVNHLDYLGVQVAWISGPWFLSIFVNTLPWESALRVWDVLLYDGNRVMLFRTALALMELYGHALVTTKDAGDATTLLQNLTGSTFDSSQLVLTACMGFRLVTESRLEELRLKHRPAILELVEERSKRGRVWKDSNSLATKLYSFKCDRVSLVEEKEEIVVEGAAREDNLDGLAVNPEVDSLPDLQEQVIWLKVELCKLLEEKRSAVLRAEELETALMEIVKQDNRRQLSARVEELEQELANVYQALSDKKEQEAAMLKVLIRVEQEQQVTEDARLNAEQEVAVQKHAVHVLQEKYEKAMASISEMEKRVVMAESMLEATLQYQSGQVKAHSSPRASRNQENSKRAGLLPFGLGWRDRNKAKPGDEENFTQVFSTN